MALGTICDQVQAEHRADGAHGLGQEPLQRSKRDCVLLETDLQAIYDGMISELQADASDASPPSYPASPPEIWHIQSCHD